MRQGQRRCGSASDSVGPVSGQNSRLPTGGGFCQTVYQALSPYAAAGKSKAKLKGVVYGRFREIDPRRDIL